MQASQTSTQPKNAEVGTAAAVQSSIPYSHLIFNQNKKTQNIMSHCRVVFDSMVFLQGLNEQLRLIVEKSLQQRKIKLKQSNEGNKLKKTLFVDLDETLVKGSKEPSGWANQSVMVSGNAVWFGVRPYAYEFLEEMAKMFEVVMFTTAELDYAQAFLDFFNSRTNGSISEFISRQGCTYIFKSLFFKDLRIVENRDLSQVVLLDNCPTSFGFLVDNGIPILAYENDPEDLELKWVAKYLEKLSSASDVRTFNRLNLNMRGILEVTKASLSTL